MTYDADFATPPGATSSLEPSLLIGLEPTLVGALLLALVVAGLIGWMIGRGSKRRHDDAASAIWVAIDTAAKAAMQADTEALPAKAAELDRLLGARLGKTMAFGGELTTRVKALKTAIKGEVEDKTLPAPPADKVAESAEAKGTDGTPGASATTSVTIVSIHPQPAPSPQPPPPPPAKPGTRPMTTPERNDALRLAVAAFNDYWRHQSAREGEMRAIVKELRDPGPNPTALALSHGTAH